MAAAPVDVAQAGGEAVAEQPRPTPTKLQDVRFPVCGSGSNNARWETACRAQLAPTMEYRTQAAMNGLRVGTWQMLIENRRQTLSTMLGFGQQLTPLPPDCRGRILSFLNPAEATAPPSPGVPGPTLRATRAHGIPADRSDCSYIGPANRLDRDVSGCAGAFLFGVSVFFFGRGSTCRVGLGGAWRVLLEYYSVVSGRFGSLITNPIVI